MKYFSRYSSQFSIKPVNRNKVSLFKKIFNESVIVSIEPLDSLLLSKVL